MCRYREIKGPKSIEAQAVGTTLQDDGCGSEFVDGRFHDRFKERNVRFIVDAFFQGDIETKVLAIVDTGMIDRPNTLSWEEEPRELMEGDCHYSIRLVECVLYPVSVMHINVDIQYSWLRSAVSSVEIGAHLKSCKIASTISLT